VIAWRRRFLSRVSNNLAAFTSSETPNDELTVSPFNFLSPSSRRRVLFSPRRRSSGSRKRMNFSYRDSFKSSDLWLVLSSSSNLTPSRKGDREQRADRDASFSQQFYSCDRMSLFLYSEREREFFVALEACLRSDNPPQPQAR